MLTAVVIAKNEAADLAVCLSSLKFCDEILVIDDLSTDQTARVAKKFHARVIKHPLADDFAQQRNFGLKHSRHPWVLFVDADEEVNPHLAAEIKAAVSQKQFQGFYLPRVDAMWGQILKHGDAGTVKLLRLGQKNIGAWQGQVHETWQIKGPTAVLNHPLIHRPHPTLADFLRSLNYYSTLRAQELAKQQVSVFFPSLIFYPLAKFFYLWISKLGFLDGTAGFIHAMSMAFYTFLVRGKLYLLKHHLSDSLIRP